MKNNRVISTFFAIRRNEKRRNFLDADCVVRSDVATSEF